MEFRIANCRIANLLCLSKFANSKFATRNLLCGFRLPTDLLFDLPVGEQVLVAASWALPRPLHTVGAPLIEHLHDQVTMQTHRRMTVDDLAFSGFCRCNRNDISLILLYPVSSVCGGI